MLLMYIQPSVEVFNIRIDEPITTITDLLLAVVCFYAFFRIRKCETKGLVKGCFKYYFLTLGLGALFGGILGHAFLYGLSPKWKLLSWVFTLVSVALIAHALLVLAKPLIKPSFARLMVRINLLILAIALIFTIWTLSFSAVKYYTIFGMVIVVGSVSYVIYQKTGSKGVARMLAAVGVGLVSAVVFSYEWGLSPWFNHNDICHVILCISALGIYKGAAMILKSPANII
jgi:hypothetical protein